jgi:hypothetical protein
MRQRFEPRYLSPCAGRVARNRMCKEHVRVRLIMGYLVSPRVLEAMQVFRNGEYFWWQVAEYGTTSS